MQQKTVFETAPDDDDLMWSIEHWDSEKIESRGAMHTDSEVEAFVHPSTATAARIIESGDGSYSVQTTAGDYDNGNCVIQSNDPTEFLSGGSSVVAQDLESLADARVVAYIWLKGWVQRNASIKGEFNVGSVVDADASPQYRAIE